MSHPDADLSAVKTSIEAASSQRVRAALTQLAGSSTDMANQVAAILAASDTAGPESKKRPRTQKCVNCGEHFTDKENVIDAPDDTEDEDLHEYWPCHFHPGKIELLEDADCWYDWNEGRGPMDDERNHRECAEGFEWQCCKEDGNSEGCMGGLHVALTDSVDAPAPKK